MKAELQFVHEELYAIRALKGSASNTNVRGVLFEATRVPDACPHVLHPEPPIVHFGAGVAELREMADQLEEAAEARREVYMRRTRKGAQEPRLIEREQRDSTNILLAGVMSLPWAPGEEPERSEKFDSLALPWLQRRFGAALKSYLEHVDEPYAHRHYIVHLNGAPVAHLHAGAGAVQAFEAKTKPKQIWVPSLLGGGTEQLELQTRRRVEAKPEEQRVSRHGLRMLQDSFFDEVARHIGLERIGLNPQPRVGYSAYRVKKIDERLEREAAELQERERMLRDMRAELDRQSGLLVLQRQQLESDRAELAGFMQQRDAIYGALLEQVRTKQTSLSAAMDVCRVAGLDPEKLRGGWSGSGWSGGAGLTPDEASFPRSAADRLP